MLLTLPDAATDMGERAAAPQPEPQLVFLAEQRQAITARLAEAQVARRPSHVARLTQALSVLRLTAGGGAAPGWFAYARNMMTDEEDEEFGL